jgi:WD40 repeat protein
MQISRISDICDKLQDASSLTDLQITVLKRAWEGKTYSAIALDLGYDSGYVRDIGSKLWRILSDTLGVEISKANFRSQIEKNIHINASQSILEESDSSTHRSDSFLPRLLKLPESESPKIFFSPQYDHSVPQKDLSNFYGREQQVESIVDSIRNQQCRLISISGMSGIGKTSLVQQLLQNLQTEFDHVSWLSLQNAPLANELILDILGELGCLNEDLYRKNDLENSLAALLTYFRDHQCLLILDSLEATLCSHERIGDYRDGYEDYGLLFDRIVQLSHQSCVICISQEQPKEISLHEKREAHHVRIVELKGLSSQDIQRTFDASKTFSGTDEDWACLVNHYGGNPLAIKLVLDTVRVVFRSSLSEFRQSLQQGVNVSDAVADLIERHFQRLSLQEKEITYWLASQPEALSYSQLQALLLSPVARNDLPRTLERLKRRSILEENNGQFTVQPMIAQYAIGRLIQELCHEIFTQDIDLLNRLSLINTQATDHNRNVQVQKLVQPLIEQLIERLGSQQQLEYKLENLKAILQKSPKYSGYAGGNLVNLLILSGADLRDRDFSNLNIWNAYLAGEQLPHLNLQGSSFKDSIFSETFGSILKVAINPDGTIVAGGTTSHEICFWKTSDTSSLGVLRGHRGWVRSIIFSPDGQWLASGSQDQTIRIWRVETGECHLILSTDSSAVWAVAFSLDSQLLISGGDDKTLRLWDISTGDCQKVVDNAHDSGISSLCITPDGSRIISTGRDSTIKIWDLANLVLLDILFGHTGSIWCSQISPDGLTLATGGDDCTVRLWSLENHKNLAILTGHNRCVWTVGFSPDGQHLVSGGHDHNMRIWDLKFQTCLRLVRGHTGFVWSSIFSLDGKFLISGGHDQTLRWWKFPQGELIKTLVGYSNGIEAIAASPTKNLIVSGGRDLHLRIWNSETGELSRTITRHSGWIRAISFSPDGQQLASASEDLSIRLWCAQTGHRLKTFTGHGCWIWSISFSPDGTMLASTSEDKTVRLWNLSTGECWNIFRGHTLSVQAVAFSADQRFLASGSLDGTVRIWEINTQQCIQTIESGLVYAVAYSPDGKWLAYGNTVGLIYLCNGVTREPIAVLQEHKKRVNSLCFSADSQYILSGSDDRTAKLWRTKDQLCIQTLYGHQDTVTSVAFGANGTDVVTGSLDTSMQVWSIKNGNGMALRKMQIPKPYEGMNIANVEGLSDACQTILLALGASIEQV